MMDAVHSRCDDKAHEFAFKIGGKLNVGMMKPYGNEHNGLPNRERQRRDADYHYLSGAIRHSQHDFAEMKAQAGGRVQIDVYVVTR